MSAPRSGGRQRRARPVVIAGMAAAAGALIAIVIVAIIGLVSPASSPERSSSVAIDVPLQPSLPPASPSSSSSTNTEAAPRRVITADAGGTVVAPAADAGAFANLPLQHERISLTDEPDPDLIEEKKDLRLPRISHDGRAPWQVYARPFDSRDDRARIAIIVTGLGLSAATTEAAIQRLPTPVTLAFNPQASAVSSWIAAARRAGHETIFVMPVAGEGFPLVDPGPQSLSRTISLAENLHRLEEVLALSPVSLGVMTLNTPGWSADGANISLATLSILRSRGLLYIDGSVAADGSGAPAKLGINLPQGRAALWIDDDLTAAAIDQHLDKLEMLARRGGKVIGLAHAYPLTMDRLTHWAATLDIQSLVLAPVSAVVSNPVTQ